MCAHIWVWRTSRSYLAMLSSAFKGHSELRHGAFPEWEAETEFCWAAPPVASAIWHTLPEFVAEAEIVSGRGKPKTNLER